MTTYIVGRDPAQVDITTPPNSNRVSRVHARIKFHDGHYLLEDMGSTGGTYVRRDNVWQKVQTLHVNPDEPIRLADFETSINALFATQRAPTPVQPAAAQPASPAIAPDPYAPAPAPAQAADNHFRTPGQRVEAGQYDGAVPSSGYSQAIFHQPPAHTFGDTAPAERQLGLFAHLSGIISWIVGPLIIMLINKDESSFVDMCAKEALNFQISIFLYVLVGFALIFVIVGLVLLLFISIIALILPIVAAIKASNGEVYRYPMTLRIIQ